MLRLIALSLLLAACISSSPAQGPLLQMVTVDTSQTAHVVIDGDTLIVLHASVRGLPIEKRAEGIAARIIDVAQSYMILSRDILVDSHPDVAEILAGDRLLMAVGDADAVFAGMARDSLANQYAAVIRAAVDRYRGARSATSIVRGTVETLLATVLFVALVWLLARLRRRLADGISRQGRAAESGAVSVIRLEWLQAGILTVLGLVRWALVAFIGYFYVGFVLARFPWTRGLASDLLELVVQPLAVLWEGLVGYLPNLFFLIVLAVVVRYILRGLRVFFQEVGLGRVKLPGFYQDWAVPTYKIVRVLVLAFAAVVAFPYIPGSSSPAFQGISIFAGILFSLGSTSAVSNIVAGVILTYMRGYKVGDIVRIGETTGRVTECTLLVTRLRTPKNVDITIPNSTVLGAHVTNYSAQAEVGNLILPTTVTIGYDAPWRQVHAMLREAAAKTADVLEEPAPFVLQKSLDDFYVTYELNVYTRRADRMNRVYSDLHRNIQDTFNTYGVQIMSPNYEADRDAPTVVPRERWYAAPAPGPGEPGSDT